MRQTPKTIASDDSGVDVKPKRVRKAVRMSNEFDILDGEVRLFHTTHSGDIWQMRMHVPSEQKYVRKSLRTRDKEAAIKLARAEYISVSARIQNGEKIFSISAKELRDQYLVHIESLVKDNQISKGRAGNIKTYTKHYMDFVGSTTKIQNIKESQFQEYRSFRQKKIPGITMTVVINESITIKQMYKWAAGKGMIQPGYLPDFGKIKARKNEVRRESFTVAEYQMLVSVGKNWFKSVPKDHPNRDEEIYYRRSIQDFILLMGHYGFRTGELVLVQNKHVKVKEKDMTASVFIPAENTKVRTQREVTGRKGDVFLRRRKYVPFKSENDFVFTHYRKSAPITKELLYDYYKALVKEVKKQHPEFDDTKTLYSLRHFWITIYLLIGKVDVYKIARYAGTSLVQIQKHYDNVKDAQVSREILAVDFTFTKDNEVELFDAKAFAEAVSGKNSET
jgi:integrase